jgi:hypothetical protein
MYHICPCLQPPILEYFGRLNPAQVPAPTTKFMSSHPASSFKLMVAVGLMAAWDSGSLDLNAVVTFNQTSLIRSLTSPPSSSALSDTYYWNSTVREALRNMIAYSDNEASAACIQMVHTSGMLPTKLGALFDSLGTLLFDGARSIQRSV